MRKTTESTCKPEERILLTTSELQNMLGCGRSTAVRLGLKANARITVGSRVFWKQSKIRSFLG